MQLNRPVFMVIMFLSIAIAGFAAGSFAGAYMLGEPGSELDPLVAESYLKEAVEQTTGELRGQIISLQEQIEELRIKLDLLESRAGAVNSPISSPSQTDQSKSPEASAKPTTNTNDTGSSTTKAPTLIPKSGQTGVVSTPAGARLRTGPSSTEYDAITVVAQGTSLEIMAEKQGWYEVKLANGTKGWIRGDLIELD